MEKMNTIKKNRNSIGGIDGVCTGCACGGRLQRYSGDKTLTIYEHGTINGGLIYVTDETGTYYTRLYSDPDPAYGMPGSMTQEIVIEIPDGATVKRARLYNTYCWSTSNGNDPYVLGLPAQAELTFSDGINT